MKIYFSGWHASRKVRELEVIATGAVKQRCFAFATLHKLAHKRFSSFTYAPWQKEVYETDIAQGIGIMLDSSAVGFRHYRKKFKDDVPDEILSDPYIDFCRKEGHRLDFYFTLDLQASSPFIYAMQKKMFKLGLKPVPVYHGDDSTDYLKRYVDMGSDLIGIGGVHMLRSNLKDKRRYLDTCFNLAEKWNFKIHGLAMTAVWQILKYPFYSIDSSSWTRTASVGCLMKFDLQRERVTILHVSDQDSSKRLTLSTESQARLRKELEDEGWDFHKLQTDHVARHCYNAITMQKIVALADSRKTSSWELLWA